MQFHLYNSLGVAELYGHIGLYTEDLIKALQRKYGSAGQEQFTAAMDLAQSTVTNNNSTLYNFSLRSNRNHFSLVWLLRHRHSGRVRYVVLETTVTRSFLGGTIKLLQIDKRKRDERIFESAAD